jgi:4-amino-4-deoxy-L-arabinose transferase-like glycosyltransferase
MPSLAAAYRVTERLWWEMSARRIVALIALLTLVRVFVSANTGLLWDEPYYWMWSQHLAAGYYDHPPMVAWWIWASTAVAGDGVPGIRLIFVLNIVATSFAAYGIGRALFGERIAWLSALWVNVMPLIGIAGFMATPDGPSTLFWTLAVFAFAMVVRTERGRWWLAVGAFAGLGLLSKYTNLFLGLGILIALALDSRLRRWLLTPWPWAGGALAILIFLPVVLWNAGNDWISFRFQFGRTVEAQFTPVFLLTLLWVQPLIFNPYAFVFLARGFWSWTSDRTDNREIGILIATALPAVVFIAFQSLHGEVLQHWLAPVFPTLTVVAVAAAAQIPGDWSRWILQRIRTDVVPLGLLAMAVVYVYAVTPLDRFYPAIDPLNSVRGWPAYAAEVEAARARAGAAWIATAGYDLTAELTYELKDTGTPIVPVTERIRYTFLPDANPALPDRPALLVVGSGDVGKIEGCFASMADAGTIERRGAGRVLATSRLFIANGAPAELLARGCDRLDD